MCSIVAAVSGGLSLFSGLAMQGAKRDAAEQTYEQEVEGSTFAENNKRNKQLALAEEKQAKKAQEAQNIFAKNIESLQATKTLLASGQVGNTINLLVMDQARQAGNYRESVRQTLESFSRQYDRNIESTRAEYQNIRNRLRSNTINAYNQIPSTGSILLGAATSAFNTELGLGEDSFFRRN